MLQCIQMQFAERPDAICFNNRDTTSAYGDNKVARQYETTIKSKTGNQLSMLTFE